jgi:hypothetical protein
MVPQAQPWWSSIEEASDDLIDSYSEGINKWPARITKRMYLAISPTLAPPMVGWAGWRVYYVQSMYASDSCLKVPNSHHSDRSTVLFPPQPVQSPSFSTFKDHSFAPSLFSPPLYTLTGLDLPCSITSSAMILTDLQHQTFTYLARG